MGFDPSNTQQIGLGAAAFILTILAVFMFTTGGRERVARAAGTGLSALVVWGWFTFFSYLSNDPWFVREMRLFASLAGAIALALTVRLATTYLIERRVMRLWEKTLARGAYLFAIFPILGFAVDALLGTSLMMRASLSAADTVTLTAGPLFFLYTVYYLALILIIPVIMWGRVRLERGHAKRAGIIFTLSISAAYAMVATGFLPWYGIENALLLIPRALAVPLFGVAMLYSITNYRLFNLRVAAAEAFVFAMWGAMFVRMLLHESFRAAIPDMVILASLIVIGLLLIRNVTRELAARIELEKLTEELNELNAHLDQKVNERTAELLRAHEHTETLVDHLPVGLIETNAHGVVVRANRYAEQLFDTTGGVARNMPLDTNPSLARLIPMLRPGSYEGTLGKSGAAERALELMVAPLSLETGEGFIIIIEDVTKKRALDRAKNDFIATAAHQLRTPISALKWTFNLLSGKQKDKESEEIVERGAIGVSNMERIAEGLMMTVRTAAGPSANTFIPCALPTLIEETIKMITPLAQQKGIALNREVSPHLPKLMLDPNRMRFAIQNLLDNAVHYTPSGGVVTLSAQETSKGVELRVSDTGIGVSPAEQEHLFERFYRSPRAVKMHTDGSGLGLAIVRNIAETHGGTLTLQSTEGVGSTFTITLPRSMLARHEK